MSDLKKYYVRWIVWWVFCAAFYVAMRGFGGVAFIDVLDTRGVIFLAIAFAVIVYGGGILVCTGVLPLWPPEFMHRATLTPTPTAIATAMLAPVRASLLSEPIKRANAFVTARGYYPLDPVLTDDGHGRHLFALPSVSSWVVTGNPTCQATHFFLEGTYLGSDTLHVYVGHEHVRVVGTAQFAIDYTTYDRHDRQGCPSISATITYTWTGDRLVASGEPPGPFGEPLQGTLVSEPQPLYIAIIGYEGNHWFRFEGERIFLPAGTSVTVALADMSEPVASHALAIPEISFRSPDTTGRLPTRFEVRFDTPGTYTFHCPYHLGEEHGVIEVVPPLTP